MRRMSRIILAAAMVAVSGPALSDIVVVPDRLVVTLTGEAAERIGANGYGSFSGQANVSCKHDPATDTVICVLELVGGEDD